MKMTLIQNLINSYESMSLLYKDIIKLMKKTDEIEKTLNTELHVSSENMFYLRLLGVLRVRMLCDPYGCTEIEKRIFEINQKDKFKDQNNVTSLNILKGFIANFVISFSTDTAQIVEFSESVPKFFGY